MTKPEMIQTLADRYNKIETISIEGANQLERVLSKMLPGDLYILKQSNIKWVSYKAGLILATKGGNREDYCLDFVVDRMAEKTAVSMAA